MRPKFRSFKELTQYLNTVPSPFQQAVLIHNQINLEVEELHQTQNLIIDYLMSRNSALLISQESGYQNSQRMINLDEVIEHARGVVKTSKLQLETLEKLEVIAGTPAGSVDLSSVVQTIASEPLGNDSTKRNGPVLN